MLWFHAFLNFHTLYKTHPPEAASLQAVFLQVPDLAMLGFAVFYFPACGTSVEPSKSQTSLPTATRSCQWYLELLPANRLVQRLGDDDVADAVGMDGFGGQIAWSGKFHLALEDLLGGHVQGLE